MKHKKMYLTLSALLFCNMAYSWPSWETMWSYPRSATTFIAATLNDLYHWRQPDTSLPTFDQLNVVSFIPLHKAAHNQEDTSKEETLRILKQKNVHDTLIINGTTYNVQHGVTDTPQLPVSVYSGGYSNGGKPYAYSGYIAIKSGLVPGACVTFDFARDTRRGFNFCQEQDQHCLDTVCKEIISKDRYAKIILHGVCKGATNNLRYLAEQAEQKNDMVLSNIKAVIAESPPISAAHALKHTPGSSITKLLMKMSMPNYNPNAKTIMQTQAFPAIPVLVGALPKDTISELDDVSAMQSHLNQSCQGKVELFVSEQAEIRHGQIGKSKDYQNAVSSFLKRNTLVAGK